MAKVIIMQGVPGSGKSTFIRALPGKVAVYSADHYFEHYGEYRFDPSKLGEAHAACMRGFIGQLGRYQNVTVVVDNTNTTVLEVAPYMAVAAAYGCEVEIVRVKCDPEVAAARNVHGVPLHAVRRMADNIAQFKAPPFWQFKLTEV